MALCHLPTERDLVLRVEFARTIADRATGSSIAVVRFVELDVDQDSTTGTAAITDMLHPDLGSNTWSACANADGLLTC